MYFSFFHLFWILYMYINYYIQWIAVILYFNFFVGPHLVVHAHQLHFGKTGSHLALKPPPSTLPHLITMATSQIKEFCHVLIGLLKKIMWTFFFKIGQFIYINMFGCLGTVKQLPFILIFFPPVTAGVLQYFSKEWYWIMCEIDGQLFF